MEGVLLGGRRLDTELVARGLVPSRERARAYILEGRVRVDGEVRSKAGSRVAPGARIEVRGEPIPYASRGGLKLASALDGFGIDVSGMIALDCGASTGGFTDCLLQRGASRVYAVDVGYGQLAWKLRNDPRVVVLERTNLRYLTRERLGAGVDITTLDVSFISLAKVWPAVLGLSSPAGAVLSLVKPQFEAGPSRVGKKGVVRDPSTHLDVLLRLGEDAVRLGFSVLGLSYSPITGPEGNIEFWIYAVAPPGAKGGFDPGEMRARAVAVVEAAHRALGAPAGRI